MDVEAGDRVRVEVVSGAARLLFKANAESPGRIGDEVTIRNPQSGKAFRAVVAGEGEVRLRTEGP